MVHTAVRCPNLALAVATFTIPAIAQVPVPSSSALDCGRCHEAQAVHQKQTPMGQASALSRDNPLFQTYPKLEIRKGPYTYRIETMQGTSTYTVNDGSRSLSIPILLSVGKRMQTWLLEWKGDYYESMVSYYPLINGLDTTIADDKLAPKSLEEAVGRKLTAKETAECLGCHATNAGDHGSPSLATLLPGVTCEHCHEGANLHAWNAAQGQLDLIPRSLTNLPAEDVSDFCGQCHRTWETVIRNGIRGQANVRFQPYRQTNSRCFDGADHRISCLACHDPHRDLVREEIAYDSKCQACHSTDSKPAQNPAAPAKSCPVAKSKCVTCHMPKTQVSSPAGFLTFTDHHIRIVKEGEAYPN